MIKDFSNRKVVWTKHASKEVLEDNFDPKLIEKNLGRIVEFPEFNGDKKRGIIRLNGRYCTLIYIEMEFGLKIITCWESSQTDIKDYGRFVRGRKKE